MVFVRYGGLSSVPQKGYDPSMPGFHSPPSRSGIYAFPQGGVELFLLGCDKTSGLHTKYQKFDIIKDKDGNKLFYTNDDGTPAKKEDGSIHYKTELKSPKKFDYRGEVWHHLSNMVKPHEVLSRKGSWVKTDIRVYERAFKRALDEIKRTHCTRDHLEVFIEKV